MGFNWVDIIILLLLASAFYGGIRIGFLTLLVMFSAFFAGLFLGGWIFPHLLPIHDTTLRAVVNGNLVLIFAVYAALHGLDFGKRLHVSLGKGKAHIIESAAGVTLSVGSAIIAVWLIAAAIGSLPFAGLSNSVNDAFTVQLLDRHLPPVPTVFEGFSTLVNPNTAPRIFIKTPSNSSIGASPSPTDSRAVTQAGKSVVRITSFGCGGIVDGSGFVIAPGLVATNAHVIAGVTRPIIKYGIQSFEATPVLFDPNMDFAVLRVSGLQAKPLQLNTTDLNTGTPVYVIGYPGSIYTLTPGVIRGSLQILGTNIYGLGTVSRNIYTIQTHVAYGSSGGPAVLSDGSVAGIIFAKSNSNEYGFALTSSNLSTEIQQAERSYSRVGTGACFYGE